MDTNKTLVIETKDGGVLWGKPHPFTKVDCCVCGEHAGVIRDFNPDDLNIFCSIACSQHFHGDPIREVPIFDAVRC